MSEPHATTFTRPSEWELKFVRVYTAPRELVGVVWTDPYKRVIYEEVSKPERLVLC